MRKYLLPFAATLALATTSLTYAATPDSSITKDSDTVTWKVSALKDDSARLIVVPNGDIEFKYLPKSKAFNVSDAAFHVELDNSNLTNVTGFKLEAQMGNQNSVASPNNARMTVDLYANGSKLQNGSWVSLVDTANDVAYDGLGDLDGQNSSTQSGNSSFQAMLSNLSCA
ncbi:common pilus major fimbrillin subunit EcpA [Dongshaea marina]|uniref:common pilus major fimbrillin subunit EcpA n=1 Tax=Dongshaea marina TaxID=2047966 RepID=UPI00131ED385|nr:common pilus major fimbrillin subunit EcpA [Dongshaea marina]